MLKDHEMEYFVKLILSWASDIFVTALSEPPNFLLPPLPRSTAYAMDRPSVRVRGKKENCAGFGRQIVR